MALLIERNSLHIAPNRAIAIVRNIPIAPNKVFINSKLKVIIPSNSKAMGI
jgi:hypothetical protein